MKKTILKISRILLATMSIGALLVVTPVNAQAATKYSISGSAYRQGRTIVTNDNLWQSGVIKLSKKANLKKGVTLQFQYKLEPGGGLSEYADGFTVLFTTGSIGQEQPKGVDMGMDGRKTSFGVEIDSYFDQDSNRSDPQFRHIAITRQDHRNHLQYKRLNSMVNGKWHKVKIVAKKGRVTVYHDSKKVLNRKLSMSDKMNVAIIGSTGAGYSTQKIRSISMK